MSEIEYTKEDLFQAFLPLLELMATAIQPVLDMLKMTIDDFIWYLLEKWGDTEIE